MTPATDPARDDAQPTDPTAPLAQEPTMPDNKPTPPETPASQRPSTPPKPPQTPLAVQLVDKVVEGMVCYLAFRLVLVGKVDGITGLGAMVGIALGQSGIRALGARVGLPQTGAVGMLVLAAGGALGLLAPHAPAVADAARTLGQRGHVRGGLLAVLAVVALAVLGATAQGCGPARETVMRLAPGVPEVSGCAPSTQRCNGAVPEVCSSSGRWWPSLPVRPDGSQRECVSCVVEDGVAGCAL